MSPSISRRAKKSLNQQTKDACTGVRAESRGRSRREAMASSLPGLATAHRRLLPLALPRRLCCRRDGDQGSHVMP